MSVFGGFQLPSLKSDTPSFPQIDEDDDDGNEEAQMLMIMNQIREHHKKTEKRKEQKSIAAKSKEACASFKKSTASDLAALKKRRRSVFEETQKSLTSIAEEHAAAEAAWKPVADAWAAEHEQKISEIVKSIAKLTEMKKKINDLHKSFSEEGEQGREMITQYVSDGIDVMADKIQQIEESKNPKKAGMMEQMLMMFNN